MSDNGATWQDKAVGHRWLLVSLQDQSGELTLVPSLRECWLDLGRGGRFGWFDSVNYTSGVYSTTARSVSFDDGVTTSAAYAGSDPQRTAAITAFDLLSERPAAGMTSIVRVRLVVALLELTVRHTTLVFRRAGTLHGE